MLARLDSIHHTALQLATSAFRFALVTSLYDDARFVPLPGFVCIAYDTL